MTNKLYLLALVACTLASCGDSAGTTDKSSETETSKTESNQTEQESEEPSQKKMEAINDENLAEEGRVACVTKQYALVKEGKFDEALKYYSAKMRKKIAAEIAATPEITKDWQAATNLSENDFQKMLVDVRGNPDSFVFEDGMWRMDQR